jgi:hypothetical protein
VRRGRKLSTLSLVFAVSVLLVLVFVARAALFRPLAVVGEAPRDGFTRLAGVVHVHTTLSDGGGTPEEVIAAAKAAGLGFVVVTDHNNLDAKPAEGMHDGVLVLVGTEISTTAGHVLGLGIPDPVYRFSGDAADALDDVRDLGGAAFAAHPLSDRDDFRWTAWELPGPWGIELLNGDSQWRAAGWGRLSKTAVLYGANHRYALLGSLTPPAATLARWDALLSQRDVPGIAGADAHSRVLVRKQTAVRFPSYESLFALMQNHVLLASPLRGDAAIDGRAVVDALARGRAYVGLDALAPAGGFFFEAEGGGRRFAMGETVPPTPAPALRAGGALPRGARLRLLRNGTQVAEAEGRLDATAALPGAYRVEVRVPGWDVPWVLSNPIYVFDAGVVEERARRSAWPSPSLPPPPKEILDAFEGRTTFEPGADERSTLARPSVDPKGGVDGGGAGRLVFRLGTPTADHPDVFCALVDRTNRDFTGKTGLSFAIRADGVYRLWVQVRDANPRSADEGTEWWFASVRTSQDWQKVAIPFARLRSINKASDGRLDLDEVRAIVFVLDKGAEKPGAEGTIWLDEVGVY